MINYNLRVSHVQSCRQHHLLFTIVVNFKNIILISFKMHVAEHFSDIKILIWFIQFDMFVWSHNMFPQVCVRNYGEMDPFHLSQRSPPFAGHRTIKVFVSCVQKVISYDFIKRKLDELSISKKIMNVPVERIYICFVK